MKKVSAEILRVVERAASSPKFAGQIADCLYRICEVDNTPHSDPMITAQNERKAFLLLESEIGSIIGNAAIPKFIPIDPAIEKHPFYTQPHYTKTPERPQGLSCRETYLGRGNLLLVLPGTKPGKAGMSLAINSHIDTVAPHIPPRRDGNIVCGRGACDAKGQVISMIAQLRLLAELKKELGVALQSDVQYQFVIEEEPGGNGSLSLAIQDPHPYDVIFVCEATQLKVHPANRGALWYKSVVNCAGAKALNPIEMAASIVLALEDEGARIKSESNHPLFPTRPVQTNHGIIGPYGSHPSAVRHLVRLWIGMSGDPAAEAAVRAAVDKAVIAYCARYGDKTKEADPTSGKPKVDHHYDLIPVKAKKGLVLAIHGKAGHMGAVLECDGAITKMAYIVRELMAKGAGKLSLGMANPEKDEPWGDPKKPLVELALEGGQGFLPTHDIFGIQKRLVKAAAAGGKEYCRKMGVAFKDTMVKTTFDKLHNDAFARKPDSPAMKAAVYAAKKAGLWKAEPIVGWNVSCDARIFAKEFPKREVVTFGPGSLTYAHSPQEQIDVREIAATAKMMAIYALALCGWEKR